VFDCPETFDFIEIVPDMMWQDAGPDVSPRYQVNADARDCWMSWRRLSR
jgi:hypothetical protein